MNLPASHKAEPLRVPPHNVEAEQAVLGGLMIKPEALNEIADWLTHEDFYRRDHALIFRAITELAATNVAPDAVTLGEWLESQGLADILGGTRYILELANTTPGAANIVAYAELVKEKSRQRQGIDIGTDLAGAMFDAKGASAGDIASAAASKLLELAGAQRIRGARNMRDIGRTWFAQLMERMDSRAMPGIPTPWGKINAKTGGLQPALFWVIAGRPSMGKTVLLGNIAVAAAMAQHRVMVFSMEQSAEHLYARAACSIANVNTNYVRQPDGDDDVAVSRLSSAVMTLQDSALVIDDSAGLTWQQVVIRAKREHMRSPLAMVLIDHLHIMRLPGKSPRPDIEYGDITREFKALAKALNVPVVLLAQLNRSLEQRANKRPIMSDLREAGSLEQDADVIVFLYRDDYYAQQEQRASEYPGIVEMNVAKWRDGETGVVFGEFHGAYSRIDHLEHDPVRVMPAKEDRAPHAGRRKPKGGE